MSLAIIAALVVLTLLVLGIVYTVNRNIEMARKRKAAAIAALQKRVNAYSSLLDCVPPHYLGSAMVQFVLKQVASALQDLLQIDPENSGALVEQDAILKQLSELTSGAKPPAYQLKSQQEAIEIRRSLMSAARFVQSLYQANQMNAQQAKQLISHLKNMAIQVTIDAYLLRALEARRESKSEVAVLMYQRAIEEIKRLPASPATKQMQAMIERNLQELGLRTAPSAFDKPTPADDGKSKLAEEFDHVLHEQDAWKKKHF